MRGRANTHPMTAEMAMKVGMAAGGRACLQAGCRIALLPAFGIGGLPVCDADGRLLGIVTNRDIRFESDHRAPVVSVMTAMPLVTAPVGVGLGLPPVGRPAPATAPASTGCSTC